MSGPFGFPFPSLVIGTGLGPETGTYGTCATAGDNHVQFWDASAPPAWHVVAVNMGHTDMLEQENCGFACTACAAGKNKDRMKRLTEAMLAAFFTGALKGDAAAYAWLTDAAASPCQVTMEQKQH